jgi:hypothetical protein
VFEAATWQEDRMTLGGLLFMLEHGRRNDAASVGEDHFRFFKVKYLVDAYEAFFQQHPLEVQNVLELGMWDGGSLAFWFEGLKPNKMVGIDIDDRTDSPYFLRFVRERNLSSQIATYWKTNQADDRALREIVRREFVGPLDIVFDDASHLYAPTKASFETLFPMVRKGGLYIIEDWSWRHWREFSVPKQWSPSQHLTRLVMELIEATGTGEQIISEVFVHQGFVGIQRGPAELSTSFRLDDHIYRRPTPVAKRILTRLLWGPERDLLAKVKKKIVGV